LPLYSKRVGIFGGTFNPIHYGHLNSIENVLALARLDEIWVVPNRQNPLKELIAGPTAENRLQIVRLALSTLDENKFKVRDDEILREGPSYTVDTLEKLTKEYPDTEFVLILGSDQLVDFDRWKNYKHILEITSLIVTSRPGSTLPQTKNELPKWLSAQTKAYRSNHIVLKTAREVQFIQLPDIEVSATEIRRKIRRNENVSNLLPSTVADYLIRNKIYEKAEVLVADYAEFTRFCAQVLNDKGGIDVHGYDVRELVQPSEFTLVASGTSTRHTRALCEHVIFEAKNKYGITPQGTEGLQEGRWVIVDYGSLMIHLFYDFVRSEYHIEDLWAAAPQIEI
jgi:nicotinate-nucleotide adenylyltransferase